MPRFLERILNKEADKKGLSGDKKGRYVFGTLNNVGAMHGNKETAKGRKMQDMHEEDSGSKDSGSVATIGRKFGGRLA